MTNFLKLLLNFLKSKTFFKHLSIAIASTVLLLVILFFSLRIYTHFGESIILPDFTGMSTSEVKTILTEKNLNCRVDTVYTEAVPPNSVVTQSPSPLSKVKEGRIIYLAVNHKNIPLTRFPNIINLPLLDAQTIIKGYGLKVKDTIYIDHIAKNKVLLARYGNKFILPGDKVKKSSLIDLVVGNGQDNELAVVPNIEGESVRVTKEIFKSYGFVIGTISSDREITDTLSSIVLEQSLKGSTVDKIRRASVSSVIDLKVRP